MAVPTNRHVVAELAEIPGGLDMADDLLQELLSPGKQLKLRQIKTSLRQLRKFKRERDNYPERVHWRLKVYDVTALLEAQCESLKMLETSEREFKKSAEELVNAYKLQKMTEDANLAVYISQQQQQEALAVEAPINEDQEQEEINRMAAEALRSMNEVEIDLNLFF
jgi:hypothetical protein